FIEQTVRTCSWQATTTVSASTYIRLNEAHRLVADVVSFRGPHINHLTPRTLDIDKAQMLMVEKGMNPKETIEGPPTRRCPILLRQTSFKALSERIEFLGEVGGGSQGTHTARCGEIEQRAIALTESARAVDDRGLAAADAGDTAGY